MLKMKNLLGFSNVSAGLFYDCTIVNRHGVESTMLGHDSIIKTNNVLPAYILQLFSMWTKKVLGEPELMTTYCCQV